MKIVIGCDEAGVSYKNELLKLLKSLDEISEVMDIGVNENDKTDYPHIGVAAAKKVASGEFDRALLICGTGMGMAISANKVKGIRASTAHDSYSIERLILSNNAQVLALGQRVIGIELAKRLVREWVEYSFDEKSASASKVEALCSYEES